MRDGLAAGGDGSLGGLRGNPSRYPPRGLAGVRAAGASKTALQADAGYDATAAPSGARGGRGWMDGGRGGAVFVFSPVLSELHHRPSALT